jgi:hypothetical protein
MGTLYLMYIKSCCYHRLPILHGSFHSCRPSGTCSHRTTTGYITAVGRSHATVTHRKDLEAPARHWNGAPCRLNDSRRVKPMADGATCKATRHDGDTAAVLRRGDVRAAYQVFHGKPSYESITARAILMCSIEGRALD